MLRRYMVAIDNSGSPAPISRGANRKTPGTDASSTMPNKPLATLKAVPGRRLTRMAANPAPNVAAPKTSAAGP